jgi:uncharacterized protein YwgA
MTENNRRELILANILNLLHYDTINTDEFNNRIIYQKIVYLLQYLGISLGYRFNWYIRGPYSPLLTRTLYILSDNPILQQSGKEKELKNIDEIKRRIAELQKVVEHHHNDAIFLEILASLAYIKRSNPKRNTRDNIIEKLCMQKPFIKELPNYPDICSEALVTLDHLEN